MLDKSVPYKHVLMRRPAGTPLPEWALPDGFSFAPFTPGDEKHWAMIETSVLEFPDPVDAVLYFQKNRLCYGTEMERRCIFIEAPGGEKIATATAFWEYTGERRDPWVDWVSVKPGLQGKGLGKALVAGVLRKMVAIEGDRDFYLHTQTWSHTAIRIYQRAGFVIVDTPDLGPWANDEYDQALAILKDFGIGPTWGSPEGGK